MTQSPGPIPAMTDQEVLTAYDATVRRPGPALGPGWVRQESPTLVRVLAPDDATWGGFIGWSDLDEATAEAAVGEQTAYFTRREGERRRPVEWKVYGHDRPAGLPALLEAAGWVPEDRESFLVGTVDDVVGATSASPPPEGVGFREVGVDTLERDVPRMAACKSAVWGTDYGWLLRELAQEKAAHPDALRIHVAEAAGEDGDLVVVCAAWLRLEPDSGFAGLWGGGTLPGFRGRGVYREVVRRRAVQAAEAGYPLLQVDASDDSRPILERLGLRVLDWTRPYVLFGDGA